MEDEKLKATKKAMGLLQHMDRTFVEIYRESRSMRRIRQDLQKRHVPEQWITLAIEAVDEDDTPALQKALEKLLRGRTELSYEEQQKVTAKLYRRGFRLDAVRRQIDLWREQNDCQY